MKKLSSLEITDKLQKAVFQLEEFSRQEVVEMPTMKTMSLMKSLLFKSDEEKEPSSPHKVLHAVEVIIRERLHIQKLQSGTPEEQKLAASFTKAIEAYNNQKSSEKLKPTAKKNFGLAKFLSKEETLSFQELPKILLPQQQTVKCFYPAQEDNKENGEVQAQEHHHLAAEALSSQAIALFHMKALSLLDQHKIASNPEARSHVIKSPIYTVFDPKTSTCILKQTISLFPGQTVVVMGSSSLDPKTQKVQGLLPKTFSVSLESTQTGFPDPSQRAGWTLANQLIPEYPQRIDLLSNYAHLIQRKKEILIELLPNGRLINKAKELIKIKKQVFGQNRQELISLHKELTQIIISASVSTLTPNLIQAIKNYYEMLMNESLAFDILTETNQLIRDLFIVNPYQRLFQAIFKEELNAIQPEERRVATKNNLQLSFEQAIATVEVKKNSAQNVTEQIKWEFILHLGPIIGKAATGIFIQYLSEDLYYAPQDLTPFESKIQASAYYQAHDFLEELQLVLSEDPQQRQQQIYQLMKTQLLADIALFEMEETPNISLELAQYFWQRNHQ